MLSISGFIIAFFTLSIIIFIHELGHFLAARKSGIRVERFSLGFGPKIVGIQRGETEYRISLLPFGGYVKMPGEDPREREGEPGEFSSAPIKNRIFVAVAGPGMNFVFAIIAFYMLYLIGVEVPNSTKTTEVGYVADDVSGIQVGDKIVSIKGKEVNNWNDVRKMISIYPDEKIKVTLIRDGREIETTIVPEKKTERGIGEYGIVDIYPQTKVMVDKVSENISDSYNIKENDIIKSINGQTIYFDEVLYDTVAKNVGKKVKILLSRNGKEIETELKLELQIQVINVRPDSPAEKAGLLPGDKIFSINGNPISHYTELHDFIVNNPNQVIALGIKRNGESKTIELIRKIDESGEPKLAGFSYSKGLINGISFTEPVRLEKYNPISAFGKGIQRSWNTVLETFWVVKLLVTRGISIKKMSGPVGIVGVTARVAQNGIRGLLFFSAFISINLGIINLLPIPIADGGQILFFLFEKLRGKPLSEKKQLIIQQVSIVLLILFFVYITWNDILKWVRPSS